MEIKNLDTSRFMLLHVGDDEAEIQSRASGYIWYVRSAADTVKVSVKKSRRDSLHYSGSFGDLQGALDYITAADDAFVRQMMSKQ